MKAAVVLKGFRGYQVTCGRDKEREVRLFEFEGWVDTFMVLLG